MSQMVQISAAELAELRTKLAAAEAKKQQKITLKVSQAGALSVYGMGRFPVTLYKSQWLKVLALAEDIKTFIAANDKALKEKT